MAMKVLERKYVGSPGRIVIASASFEVVRIPALQEGRISKISVKQNGGTNVAFVVDAFDSKVAAGAAGEFANPYAPVSPTAYRIIAQLSATAGNEAFYRDTSGQAFRNFDNLKHSDSEFGFFLVIAPTAAGGSTEWDVAVTIIQEALE